MISPRLAPLAVIVSLALSISQRAYPLQSQSPSATSQARHFALDDLWSLVNLSDIEISDDARTVAVVTDRANPGANRFDRVLIAIDTATASARTLFEGHDVASPHWSSTGQIAFLAQDGATSVPQVFVLSSSGSARAVTNFPSGVEHFA